MSHWDTDNIDDNSAVSSAAPAVASSHAALDTSNTASRADLRGAYLRRYAVLKNPLPSEFSPDDPLQARLANGAIRCCVIDIGPALSPTLSGKSQFFDGAPWVVVWFDDPDANGAVEEVVPFDCLDFLDEWATSVPGSAAAGVIGKMPAMFLIPPDAPLAERRSEVTSSQYSGQGAVSDFDPDAE